ncbi:zinc ribbon domain-containing protein [Micromonospora sp. 4G55]|uniref:zinc ribbon domain-containing protein n=1 Tax=Micromonospora sp. 4G55 TaxID=2806102 RepID=UPI0035C6DDA4
MLEYKAARYGRTFARVDRFFPSTRMCSDCGRINDKMALNVRTWKCPCGSTHDRDANAAINVLAAGRAESLNDRGARIRPPAMVAPRGEAVIHPDAARSTRSLEGTSVPDGGEIVNVKPTPSPSRHETPVSGPGVEPQCPSGAPRPTTWPRSSKLVPYRLRL